MSKLIKKYEEFLNEAETAKPETEEETIKKPATAPPKKVKKLGQPSVSPDPLALADLEDLKNGKKSNPKIIDNEYLYNDLYNIAYPSETKCYTVNNVKLSSDPQSVIDYINQKEDDKKNKYPDGLSDVTVGEDGKLKGFNFGKKKKDTEEIAATGYKTEVQPGSEELSESKSYKSSRKFNKRK
jgi:hypothetical protein